MIIVVTIIESPVLSHQPLARSLDLVFSEWKGARGAGGQMGPFSMEKELGEPKPDRPLLLWKRS